MLFSKRERAPVLKDIILRRYKSVFILLEFINFALVLRDRRCQFLLQFYQIWMLREEHGASRFEHKFTFRDRKFMQLQTVVIVLIELRLWERILTFRRLIPVRFEFIERSEKNPRSRTPFPDEDSREHKPFDLPSRLY
jgi:hypothetical protein